ncbi:hypothetical protein [Tortoise microvirus 6]|nr:hypothetical protein [Tortoise microvirus 6]
MKQYHTSILSLHSGCNSRYCHVARSAKKKIFHLTHVKKSNKNYPQSNKKMLTTFFICVILILGGWHDLYNA